LSSYGLTRDDGEQLLLTAPAWEAALEIAFHHGWRPAGTSAPLGPTSRGTPWDTHDYFTHQRQHVRLSDALALGQALARGLDRDPDICTRVAARMSDRRDTRATGAPALATKDPMRRPLQRLADFAQSGGFTIHSA